MNELPPDIDKILAGIENPSVRGRCVHEYKTVRRMVAKRVSWESARVLDFGCGEGIAAASFALRHPSSTVLAVDILPPRPEHLGKILQDTTKLELPDNLKLLSSPPGTLPREAADLDLVFAWSVFEHVNFADLTATMSLVGERLKPSGTFFLQINPLFHSPRGAHLYGYNSTPWVHLLTQHDALERIVMGAETVALTSRERVWEQYETLNKATAEDILGAARAAGFDVLKEERLKTDLEPPERLARIYLPDALTTEEIRLVLAKHQ